MNYEIIEFNKLTGTVLVKYWVPEYVEGVLNSIPVPIEEGAYITGKPFEDYILEHAPVTALERVILAKNTTVPEVIPPTPISQAVPQSVSRRQFKLALLQQGLLDTIQDYIIGSKDRELQLEWTETVDFERANLHLNALAATLGKTQQDLDSIFILASTL